MAKKREGKKKKQEKPEISFQETRGPRKDALRTRPEHRTLIDRERANEISSLQERLTKPDLPPKERLYKEARLALLTGSAHKPENTIPTEPTFLF